MSNNLDINLRDPSVQRLLGTDDRIVRPGHGRRSMVQLAGDPSNPTQHGISSTTRLDLGKQEAIVVFKDHVMTVDIYEIEGQPLEMIYICPRCQNQGRITSEMKKLEWDPRSTRPVRLPDGSTVAFDRPLRVGDHVMTNAGTLSVEPFECSWELKDTGKHTPGIRAGGLTLCRLKLVIDHNVAREA